MNYFTFLNLQGKLREDYFIYLIFLLICYEYMQGER